jgi:DNA-binding response OmpR family regulator
LENLLKPKILICGKDLVNDDLFLDLIQKNANTLFLKDLNNLENEVKELKSKILLFEFSKSFEDDLLRLKLLKAAAPWLEILVIGDGISREEVIRTFRSGIRDYFKKPYNTKLLVERLEALLKFV